MSRRVGDRNMAAMVHRHAGGKTLYQNHLREKAERLHRETSSVEAARRHLQRRGHIVYRASVQGGDPDRWIINNRGDHLSDDELVARAVKAGFQAELEVA